MPHINHRRGDTRRRSKQTVERYFGEWNRQANRFYRAAESRVLGRLRVLGFDPETLESVVFPVRGEIDDFWYYD